MRLLPLLPLIAMLVPAAFAQEAPGDDVDRIGGPPTGGSGWSFGGAVIAREGIYAGESEDIIPLPYIGYEGEKFFIRGLSGGYHLLQNETFAVDLALSINPGITAKDFGLSELAANGVNRAHLDDREWAADAGISASVQALGGQFKFDVKADVTDQSGGQELGIGYEYPIFLGQTMLTPSIGARYLTEDRANYYYGTLSTEVARGAPNYKPGAVTIPYVGLGVMHNLTPDWTVIGMAEYNMLPEEITDSPLMDHDKDGYFSVIFGVARSF